MRRTFLIILLTGMLAACENAAQVGTAQVGTAQVGTIPRAIETTALSAMPAASMTPTSSPAATRTALPTDTPTLAYTATADTRPLPRNWSSWPIVPKASAKAVQIYQAGQKKGVEAHTFTIVGDCQSSRDVFMGIYGTDRNPIGNDHPELLETIGVFKDSFNHDSAAVRDGLSAPSALDPLWADSKRCKPNENPVACELRLSNPTIVFVNLGTNWRAGASADKYEGYLRKIVDLILANGSLPVLTNKADNVEGDHSLNLATAKVAYDYDIPLMNFWLAADSLPNHGLDPDRNDIYLTPAGWDVRNFVALRTLDSVWRTIQAGTP